MIFSSMYYLVVQGSNRVEKRVPFKVPLTTHLHALACPFLGDYRYLQNLTRALIICRFFNLLLNHPPD